ncbi:FimB/Mfa2 family fimbrial subunit [Flavobacterium gawalongense]|uniref:Secretion protein n=1 Tax=Flavobacterium gawalongense TaxID=2594432 RepID=A0A553BCM2_9FLAO|nr:FimB/Mfa2 family fimbrial subunit [Flavobacterium gawalongense]TRX00995.1 secretion protein [Flavobacterium gawalongense]TRX05466.1 secretion protein [Flavobacterium gawalongense]TRX05990.1 secretion protein [Flavobacterium gawalongense]TRX07065.1 secretion protein [Flavobacterium gawalongense]TRX23184.1 secretion protein [Flavobacterium gawalongense]
MKKISKLSLLLVVAMTSMSSYAIDSDFLLNVKKGKGNEISFSLNQIKKVNVSIYDDKDNLIYTENATGETGILRTYNLDEFPVGIYYLVVENNLKKVRHEIIISEEKSILTTKAISEVYKPALKNKNVANVD